MSRFLVFAFLFVCLVYMFQASPVPEDTDQTSSNNFDDLTNRAKKMFDEAKDAIEKTDFGDAFEKAKSALGQAGENIKKEIEKIADKLRD